MNKRSCLKHAIKGIIFVWLMLLPVGCSNGVNQSNEITPINDHSGTLVVSTLLPEHSTTRRSSTISIMPDVFFPTITTSPTPAISLSLTVTPIEKSVLPEQSIEIVKRFPEPGKYSGNLVLLGYSDAPDLVIDLSIGKSIPIVNDPDTRVYLGTTSPDHLWLAYISRSPQKNMLVVESFCEEKEVIRIEWEEQWGLGEWLDDKHLLIGIGSRTWMALNPFTGEQKQISIDLPDLGDPIGVGVDYWGPAVFNPALTHVVYPADPGYPDGRIVLFDYVRKEKIRALLSENNPYGGEPVWSPEGYEFVLTLQKYDFKNRSLTEELYLVTQEGQSRQLTLLSDSYSKHLNIESYRWSPDGTQIAMWILYGWENSLAEDRFAILNVNTGDITIYNLRGGLSSNPPVWSPDGKYLLIDVAVDENYPTILLDPHLDLGYWIAENARPVGWLK